MYRNKLMSRQQIVRLPPLSTIVHPIVEGYEDLNKSDHLYNDQNIDISSKSHQRSDHKYSYMGR